MRIYIAASWKNQHAVEMLTDHLRAAGHEVLSFVENNHGENPNSSTNEAKAEKSVPFDEWCETPDGQRSFDYDTNGAMFSDLVIYVGPSGKDAAAEVGMAFSRHVPILGLWAKGEDFGLMRKMMLAWYHDYRKLIDGVERLCAAINGITVVECIKCGIADTTGKTPRTASRECDPHDWKEAA